MFFKQSNNIKNIDVVVVNWNSGNQLKRCIESIKNNSEDFVSNIIVVDNNSSDDSCSDIIESTDLRLISENSNLGFGAASNIGAKIGNSNFILFINPDAKLYAGTLRVSLDYLHRSSNFSVGIVGVRLVDELGHVVRSCAKFPSALNFISHAMGLDRIFLRVGYFMSWWGHDQTRDVDHVIGAFYLVRRELFEALGGFDENFFVYLEDLDFSYRARQAGWRSVYLADTQSFHAGGGVSNQVKAQRLFYSIRSRVLYAFKHFSKSEAMLVLIASFIIEPIFRWTLAIMRRSWPTLKETWQGYAMLWHWLPKWVFK